MCRDKSDEPDYKNVLLKRISVSCVAVGGRLYSPAGPFQPGSVGRRPVHRGRAEVRPTCWSCLVHTFPDRNLSYSAFISSRQWENCGGNLKTSWLKQDWTLTEKNNRGCESVQCFIQSKRGEQRVVMYTQFNIINSDEKCLSTAFLFTTKTRRWRAKSRSLIIKPSVNTVFCFHCWDETNMSVFCCWIFKQLIIFFHNYAFSPSTTKTTRDKNHFSIFIWRLRLNLTQAAIRTNLWHLN